MSEPQPRPARVSDGAGDPNCPHCHGRGYLREEVPPGHALFGRLQPCVCQLEHMQQQRAARLRQDSNTESLSGKTFDNFLPEGISPDPEARATLRAAYERARTFVESPTKWLLLTGTYGSGKTHLAAAIANACLQQGKPVLFLNTPDLLDYLRETFSPAADVSYSERFEEIRGAPILILDDLGTESPTPWATEKLYQIINYRYNARLPTVITTNKDLKDIDQRVASRLSDAEIVDAIHVRAPDFRAGHLNLTAEVSSLAVHRHQTFESFDPRPELVGEARQAFGRALQAAREYAEQPDGWLVLAGPYGAGKTHLAAAVANLRAQRGKPVVFVTYQDLNDLVRISGNREKEERNTRLLQQLRQVEFLVLDDVPPQIGGLAREKFFQLITYRFDAQLPTVLTTVAEEKELDPRLKARVFYADFCRLHVLSVSPYEGRKRAGRKK